MTTTTRPLRADAPVFVPAKVQQRDGNEKSKRNRQRGRNKGGGATSRDALPPKKTKSHHRSGRNRRCNNRQKNNKELCGKNHRQHGYKEAVKIENDNLLQPVYFPALSTTTDDSSADVLQKKAVWVSEESSTGAAAAIKQEPACVKPTTLSDDDDDDDKHGMTVLRPLPKRQQQSGKCSSGLVHHQAQQTQSTTIEVHDCVEAQATAPVAAAGSFRRRKGMTRLRDRWWSLLQEHNDKRKLLQEDRALLQRQEKEEKDKHSASLVNVDHTAGDLPGSCSNSDSTYVQAPDEAEFDNGDDNDFSLSSSTASCSEDDYTKVKLPLHEAIRRNDAVTLERLLLRNGSKNNEAVLGKPDMTPLQLAVHLDRPHLVQILCDHKTKFAANDMTSFCEYDAVNGLYPPPLLLAAECGHEECLQILLLASSSGSSVSSLLLSTRDSQGNTALHCCCRGGEATLACSTFNLLLDRAAASSSSSSGNTSSVLFKILSCKNNQQQTPLHVACQYGRTDIVDAILTHRSANMTVLSKLFALQDIERQTPMLAAVASGSTDIVMSLLMWRGNNNHAAQYKRTTQPSLLHGLTSNASNCGSSTSSPCPLIWAVRAKNVEMVQLLLEFNDPLSGSGYSLNAALRVAVNNSHTARCSSYCVNVDGKSRTNLDDDDDDSYVRSEIARILVDAGANPCAQLDETKPTVASSRSYSAVVVAATHHDSACLVALLDSYRLYLDRIHNSRRRDPKLQKQPESFFAGMESIEHAEMKSAMRESLVAALFHAWSAASSLSSTTAGSQSSSAYVACALALYRRGTRLLQSDLDRLRLSLIENTLKPAVVDTVPELPAVQYEACYPRIVGCWRKEKSREKALHYLSNLMLDLPWFDTNCATIECSWIATQAGKDSASQDNNSFLEPDVVLVSQDGERFLAHAFVLSHSSDKLAAAIRFASMSREQADEEQPRITHARLTEIHLDVSAATCRQMLEHMYHGSITRGLSRDRHHGCQELLELLLVAEEYLCRSLVQECEMRLLSSDQFFRGCFCCYCRAKVGRIPTELNRKALECFYRVSGPSWLVTPAQALDVLAIVQHVSEACCETDYSLRLVSSNTESTRNSSSTSNDRMKGVIRNPLEALLEVALYSVLSDFDAVARSPAFVVQFEDVLNDATSEVLALEMLLQMSLQNLSEVARSSQSPPEAKPTRGPVVQTTFLSK